jgi:hypothetical protein
MHAQLGDKKSQEVAKPMHLVHVQQLGYNRSICRQRILGYNRSLDMQLMTVN